MSDTLMQAAIQFAIRKQAFALWVEDDCLYYYADRGLNVHVRGYTLLNSLARSAERQAAGEL